MLTRRLIPALALAVSGALGSAAAVAADQTQPGAGNAAAESTAAASPLVQSTQRFLVEQAKSLADPVLRRETVDAIGNPRTCLRHRANLDTAAKDARIAALLAAGLLNPADAATFPGGLRAGVYPPVRDDGSACPKLPMKFEAAPGSGFGGHHSYPGGLPIHEANNDLADVDLAAQYRRVYGTTAAGVPRLGPASAEPGEDAAALLDQDLIVAAPLWHDWAKPLVFQWNADGTEFSELSIGGGGSTDNYGNPGDSRTGGHHILGIAEAMARGLSPAFVITQASAHSAPTLGNEYKVVNWLRAAAILAGIDPVARGYLAADAAGRLRLPPLRRIGDVALNSAGQTNLLTEYQLHNLSDADFTNSIPAVGTAQALLARLAPEFGYDPADAAVYNVRYRNPALSWLSAEHVLMVYGERGLDAVRAELQTLRRRGVL
jgi:hypothetical protein